MADHQDPRRRYRRPSTTRSSEPSWRRIQQFEAILWIPLIEDARFVRSRDGIHVSDPLAAHQRLDLGSVRAAADAVHPPLLGWAEVGIEALVGAAATVVQEEGQILGEGEHRLIGAHSWT